MAITINWITKVIYVPKSFMTTNSATLYTLDVNAFRIALKEIEDSPDGMTQLDTHRHNSPVTLAGVTYARSLEIINGYTVTFEDGQYVVKCEGANHNIADVKNLNQVSLIVGNAAGLIAVNTSGGVGTVAEVADAVWNATAASHLTAGSTGAVLSAVPTAATIADAVRTELTTELTHIMQVPTTGALTGPQANMLLEMYELLGLDPAKPLIVTQTTRSAGTINQNITGNASTTTVTRV